MESGDVLAMCMCIYSTSRERKRLFGCCFHPRPGSRLGKISRRASAFLDESPAWVLRKSLFYECTISACNSPLAFAIVQRSAWSLPMFRTDAPPIHLTNRRTFALFTIPFNLQDIDETRQMRSGFPGNVDTSAQHSGNFSRLRARPAYLVSHLPLPSYPLTCLAAPCTMSPVSDITNW